MGFSNAMRAQARDMYVEQRKSLEEISAVFGKGGPTTRTLKRWRSKDRWDADLTDLSPSMLMGKVRRAMLQILDEAEQEGTLKEGALYDKLCKMMKILDRLGDMKIHLGNILALLEDVTTYVLGHVDDDTFVNKYQAILPGLAQHLREKHGS